MIFSQYHWPPIMKDWEYSYALNPSLTMAAYARANKIPESTFRNKVRKYQKNGILPKHIPPKKQCYGTNHNGNFTLVVKVFSYA